MFRFSHPKRVRERKQRGWTETQLREDARSEKTLTCLLGLARLAAPLTHASYDSTHSLAAQVLKYGGPNLSAYLAQSPALSSESIEALASQLFRLIFHIASHGVFLGDIKFNNIVVKSSDPSDLKPEVRSIDFETRYIYPRHIDAAYTETNRNCTIMGVLMYGLLAVHSQIEAADAKAKFVESGKAHRHVQNAKQLRECLCDKMNNFSLPMELWSSFHPERVCNLAGWNYLRYYKKQRIRVDEEARGGFKSLGQHLYAIGLKDALPTYGHESQTIAYRAFSKAAMTTCAQIPGLPHWTQRYWPHGAKLQLQRGATPFTMPTPMTPLPGTTNAKVTIPPSP